MISLDGRFDLYDLEENVVTDKHEICSPEADIQASIQNGGLTANQALWLHTHQVSWEISVER